MQRKVGRKVIATFCAPERHHHAMVVARMLRSAVEWQVENSPVRPEGHACTSGEGIEDEAGGEAASQQSAVEDEVRQPLFQDVDRARNRFGQAGRRRDKIDHERQADAIPACEDATQAETAQLDPARKCRMRPGREIIAFAGEADSIIAHQGRRNSDQVGAVEEKQGEGRFAGARVTPDQNARLTERDAGGMDRFAGRGRVGHRASRRFQATQRLTAGRRTRKRAPRTVGSPSSSAGPGRFSARIVPRWACTIWREIERPRPEFWPKPCSGRSV